MQTWNIIALSFWEAYSRFNQSVPPEQHILRFYLTDARLVFGIWVVHALVVGLNGVICEGFGPFEMRWSRFLLNTVVVTSSGVCCFFILRDAIYPGFGLICNNSFPGRLLTSLQTSLYYFFLTRMLQLVETWLVALGNGFSKVLLQNWWIRLSNSFVSYLCIRFNGGGDEWLFAFLILLLDVLVFAWKIWATSTSTEYRFNFNSRDSIFAVALVSLYIMASVHNATALAMRCGMATFLQLVLLVHFALPLLVCAWLREPLTTWTDGILWWGIKPPSSLLEEGKPSSLPSPQGNFSTSRSSSVTYSSSPLVHVVQESHHNHTHQD